MTHSTLMAPWRIDYIRSLNRPEDDKCFLCQAGAGNDPEHRRQALILWTTAHSLVLMNRFPYTNGHLLVAPIAHEPELDQLSSEQLLDMQLQSARAVRLLRRAVSAQGFNIGMNLGRCAGAGVPGHLHQHIVPRWAGDTNFMSVVGETQVVPEAVSQLYHELLRLLESESFTA